MSDESVQEALRSNAPLVVIEAPGGCGKTHQGASYARELAQSGQPGKVLILTHTHAACSVFHARTRTVSHRVDIRTIDSVIAQVTAAYHAGLGLPADTSTWARQNDDGYDWLAVKAAALVKRYPDIALAIACRYPTIICDEHQDSTGERHAFIMALHEQGAKLRIFADPMQSVLPVKVYIGGRPALDWDALTRAADRFEQLDRPHRWTNGCPLLGVWILGARAALKRGDPVDLRQGRPPSVTIVRADNEARRPVEFRPARADRRPIDAFIANPNTLLLLTRRNIAARSLRSAFHRQIPLWEGHTRQALEIYVDSLTAAQGDRSAVADAVVTFIQATAIGFTDTDFANTFRQDVADECRRNRRLKPAKVQQLAALIVAAPNHQGASHMLKELARLRSEDADFRAIKIDAVKEYYEGAKLGTFVTAEEGFAEICHRRTYARPEPDPKSISNIHKSKGLERHSVIVAPCDAETFPDNQMSRCLLYVAMSRPTDRLMLVVPRERPSPLLWL